MIGWLQKICLKNSRCYLVVVVVVVVTVIVISDLPIGLRERELVRVRLSNFETATLSELSFLSVATQ